MNAKEERIFKEIRLRNLERKHAKLIQHPDLLDECIELKRKINTLKKELNY
ncbi:TPA_asm: hypothetical protein CBHJFHIM_00057 [Methanobrevibacter gottschalkii virus vir075]|uniref:Uncharacterized protein n=1 Tax=Methanobrevibacter gottschalkii TaxID=190974 RepID=A0A1H7IDH8_9EURY|nr:hypothetical protein [Methanobrevibacter gottschalkii]SEK59590.1 hypothetical protein SAMN05216439_1189 [Methanobrevibacter gottschalkii]